MTTSVGLAVGDAPVLTEDAPFDVKRIDALCKDRRFAGAAFALDKVLADSRSGQRLCRAAGPEDPVWTSARELARRRLLALPAVAREALEARHGEDARERFAAAWRAGSPAALAALADRHPCVEGAARAVAQAGDLYFEEGELGAARRAWTRAVEVGGPSERARLASRLSKQGLVAGSSPHSSAPASPVPASPPLVRLWRCPLGEAANGPPARSGAGQGAVFVSDALGVAALEVETGRLLWRTEAPRSYVPGAVTAARDRVVALRDGRSVVVLARETGQVHLGVEIAALKGTGTDQIDAAAWRDGRLVVAARIDQVRVVAAFDGAGSLVFKTALWSATGPAAALLVERDRIGLAADGAIASLVADGGVLWVRGLAMAGGGVRRADAEAQLVRAGDELVYLGPAGVGVYDGETGVARTCAPIDERGVALGVRGAEPLVLTVDVPPRPATGVTVHYADEEEDENEERPRTVTVSAISGSVSKALGRLGAASVFVKPPHGGTVSEGRLYLQGDGVLRVIDLAAWRILAEVPSDGAGRVSLDGPFVTVTGARGIEVFGPKRARPRPMGEEGAVLEGGAALAAAAPRGPGPALATRFAPLVALPGASVDLHALVDAVVSGAGVDAATRLLEAKPLLVGELGALLGSESSRPIREAAAELLVRAGGADEASPGRGLLERALRSEDRSVRAPAFRALFDIGGREGRELAVSTLPDAAAQRAQLEKAKEILKRGR